MALWFGLGAVVPVCNGSFTGCPDSFDSMAKDKGNIPGDIGQGRESQASQQMVSSLLQLEQTLMDDVLLGTAKKILADDEPSPAALEERCRDFARELEQKCDEAGRGNVDRLRLTLCHPIVWWALCRVSGREVLERLQELVPDILFEQVYLIGGLQDFSFLTPANVERLARMPLEWASMGSLWRTLPASCVIPACMSFGEGWCEGDAVHGRFMEQTDKLEWIWLRWPATAGSLDLLRGLSAVSEFTALHLASLVTILVRTEYEQEVCLLHMEEEMRALDAQAQAKSAAQLAHAKTEALVPVIQQMQRFIAAKTMLSVLLQRVRAPREVCDALRVLVRGCLSTNSRNHLCPSGARPLTQRAAIFEALQGCLYPSGLRSLWPEAEVPVGLLVAAWRMVQTLLPRGMQFQSVSSQFWFLVSLGVAGECRGVVAPMAAEFMRNGSFFMRKEPTFQHLQQLWEHAGQDEARPVEAEMDALAEVILACPVMTANVLELLSHFASLWAYRKRFPKGEAAFDKAARAMRIVQLLCRHSLAGRVVLEDAVRVVEASPVRAPFAAMMGVQREEQRVLERPVGDAAEWLVMGVERVCVEMESDPDTDEDQVEAVGVVEGQPASGPRKRRKRRRAKPQALTEKGGQSPGTVQEQPSTVQEQQRTAYEDALRRVLEQKRAAGMLVLQVSGLNRNAPAGGIDAYYPVPVGMQSSAPEQQVERLCELHCVKGAGKSVRGMALGQPGEEQLAHPLLDEFAPGEVVDGDVRLNLEHFVQGRTFAHVTVEQMRRQPHLRLVDYAQLPRFLESAPVAVLREVLSAEALLGGGLGREALEALRGNAGALEAFPLAYPRTLAYAPGQHVDPGTLIAEVQGQGLTGPVAAAVMAWMAHAWAAREQQGAEALSVAVWTEAQGAPRAGSLGPGPAGALQALCSARVDAGSAHAVLLLWEELRTALGSAPLDDWFTGRVLMALRAAPGADGAVLGAFFVRLARAGRLRARMFPEGYFWEWGACAGLGPGDLAGGVEEERRGAPRWPFKRVPGAEMLERTCALFVRAHADYEQEDTLEGVQRVWMLRRLARNQFLGLGPRLDADVLAGLQGAPAVLRALDADATLLCRSQQWSLFEGAAGHAWLLRGGGRLLHRLLHYQPMTLELARAMGFRLCDAVWTVATVAPDVLLALLAEPGADTEPALSCHWRFFRHFLPSVDVAAWMHAAQLPLYLQLDVSDCLAVYGECLLRAPVLDQALALRHCLLQDLHLLWLLALEHYLSGMTAHMSAVYARLVAHERAVAEVLDARRLLHGTLSCARFGVQQMLQGPHAPLPLGPAGTATRSDLSALVVEHLGTDAAWIARYHLVNLIAVKGPDPMDPCRVEWRVNKAVAVERLPQMLQTLSPREVLLASMLLAMAGVTLPQHK